MIMAALITHMTYAAPAPSRSVIDVDDTTPTIHDVAAAAVRARAGRCRMPSCVAIEAVDELIKIVIYMNGHVEMGNAKILYSQSAVWRWRRRALLDRPNLYPAFCATGVRLLSRVSSGTDAFDVPVTLLVAAIDLDLRNHANCTRDMVAALPHSPMADEIRMNAYTECRYDWHPRPQAACETLVEGLPVADLRQ